ncbi:TPA: hypothetical protein TZW69_001203 [Streptococcus suis]|uniref:Transposase n=1 Tax=Streptococcus suis TaxID=1307 RepID=A0A0Z8IB14_STRSU|nr:hypothetical protein [Streptococcus suis]MCK3889817.1 hypothetical protein [Streptococcus suis]MCQ8272389.1 hypothetical protein [Streptococcus suis]MCQ8785900.1 hypothetical protein [Streptococcus suis]MDW8721159.1 hypothetical protein [Streptococcus suis]MDY7593928.1 hypothetical protein [Streptococcus suis]
MWNKELDREELYYSSLRYAREEGIEKGIEKGIEQNKIVSACNFLRSGFSVDVIAQNLELPLEQVIQLQRDMLANP